MHAKTDSSEITSYASSPPRRTSYYVQSPSHESTPAHSPAGSPPRGHHSRESSTSRFSGSIKPGGSGKINGNHHANGDGRYNGEKGGLWRDGGTINEEDGLLREEMEDEMEENVIPKKCVYALGFILAFLVLFFFFALILWGASRNKHPIVTINSITFHNFVIQAGTDASLVPTELSTLNSTLKLSYRNTGTFFGVHVSSTPLALYYSQVVLATGNINNFYEKRKSRRNMSVNIGDEMVPLYGGGVGLSSTPVKGKYDPIPLTLNFTLRSRAYVLGKVVEPKFYTIVQCAFKLDLAKLGNPISLKDSCDSPKS